MVKRTITKAMLSSGRVPVNVTLTSIACSAEAWSTILTKLLAIKDRHEVPPAHFKVVRGLPHMYVLQ